MDYKNLYKNTFSEIHASKEIINETLAYRNLRNTRRFHLRLSKFAAIICCLLLAGVSTVAYAAYNHLGGFSILDYLTKEEETKFVEEFSSAIGGEGIDEEGNHYYYDIEGNLLFQLTETEALAYEQDRSDKHKQSVQESTNLLDLNSMELMPNGISNLTSDAKGSFPDFLLANGYMVILQQNSELGWNLQAGEKMTLSFTVDEESYVSIGVIKDSIMVATETVQEETIDYTFTANEDGIYYFSITYASAASGKFTDGFITPSK